MSDYIFRHVEPQLREAMNRASIVIIRGAYKSGKTTLARKMAAELGMRFVELSDQDACTQVQDQPQSLIKNLSHSGAVLDDLQSTPALVEALKEYVSTSKSFGKFLITVAVGGSSVDQLICDALTVELNPPTQGELIGLAVPSDFLEAFFVAYFIHGKQWLGSADAWSHAVDGGYFDLILATDADARSRFRVGYLDSLGLSNLLVRKGFDADKIGKLLRFLTKIAKSSGGLLSASSLGNWLQESIKTIESWLEILESVGVVRRLRNYDDDELNPLRDYTKCYVCNSGVLSVLNKWEDGKVAKIPSARGILLEGFVFTEFNSSITLSPHHKTELYYYRDVSDREVDFVLIRGKFVVAVEVKSSVRPGKQDFKGLKHLRDKVGANFVCGVVLYTGTDVLSFGGRLYAVPVSRLWGMGGVPAQKSRR